MIQKFAAALAALSLLVVSACSPMPAGDAENASTQADAKAEEKKEASVAPSSTGSFEGATARAIVERGKLRVGMSGDQAPFNAVSKAGEYFGLEVDLARALARSLGVELEVVEMPFADLLPAVEGRRIDMAMSAITMTPARNLKVSFVGPYFASGKGLLTKDETLANAEEQKDLSGSYRLAALEGSTSEDFIKAVAPEAKLILVKTPTEGVQSVIDDRADALVADFPICALALLRNPDSGLVGLAAPLSFEPIGIAIASGDAHFENLLENYMNILEGTGLLTQLRAAWFENASWLNQLPNPHFTPSDDGPIQAPARY